MLTLKGRTCVFAGATGNIGRGAVRALAQGGMNVVMVTHNPDSARDIIRELDNCPGQVTAMSNANGDGSVFSDVEKKYGTVDVVINTTGGLNAVVPVAALTEKEMNQKLSHQVTQPFLMMQSALPFLKKSKAPRIIFTSSAGAQNGNLDENMLDSVSRGAVLTMTKYLARALSGDGITVNCIARSGMINDHEPHKTTDFDVADIAGKIPLGHIGTAEEFGALVSYISSEESGFITGQIFNLSGGLQIG